MTENTAPEIVPTRTPGTPRRQRPVTNWHTKTLGQLTRGERAADRMRNGMGSWWFVGSFLVFMVVWAVANSFAFRWDPYPFILLNLFLSMLAGLQGAILLIAAKRQDSIAAALSQHDFDTNLAAKEEIEELMAIIQNQHAMLAEIHAHTVSGRHELPTND